MMRERTNEARSHAGMESAVRHRYLYIGERGPVDRQEALTDLMADLRHAFTPEEFEAALRLSLDHFYAETGRDPAIEAHEADRVPEARCDVCEQMKPAASIRLLWSAGTETWACDTCRSEGYPKDVRA